MTQSTAGNLRDFDLGGRELERVAITSDDLAKRVLRLRASDREIGVRFEDDVRLHDGDIVYVDERRVIAVDVVPDDVLVCRPATIAQALTVAHALGNRHLPMQIDGDAIVVRYDRLVVDLLADHHVAHARESRVLAAPFRHANAPHGHA